MKKLSFVVMGFLTSVLFYSALAVSASKYVAGEDYEVISDKLSSSPEVTEVFSYFCPACNAFEHVVKAVKPLLPAGVKFNKSHVDFMHQATKPVQQALSRALVAAGQLKLSDKMNEAIFGYIHRDKKKFTSEADIRQVFVDNGVDGEAFDKVMKSFRVKTQANRMKKYQQKLSKSGHLRSIPTLIVNGKYMLNREGLRTPADYNALITHLLTLK